METCVWDDLCPIGDTLLFELKHMSYRVQWDLDKGLDFSRRFAED